MFDRKNRFWRDITKGSMLHAVRNAFIVLTLNPSQLVRCASRTNVRHGNPEAAVSSAKVG